MEKEKFLDKYLQDKLTETERQAFDSVLKNDPELREEAAFQMDVKRAVTANEDEAFKEMLADFEFEASADEANNQPVEQPKIRLLDRKWLVAASLAVLVGLTYFFTLKSPANPQDLFAQNFKPYRNVTHPIVKGETKTDAKTKAFSAYSKENYEEALPLFSELYTTHKEPYYLFYIANALIGANRAKEAVPLLKQHLKTKDSLNDNSYWYLAMAYLQLEDTEKAKEALKKVVETEGYKSEEAKKLLDVL